MKDSYNISKFNGIVPMIYCFFNKNGSIDKVLMQEQIKTIYQKTKPFGIKSSIYKGNDPDELHNILNKASSYVRKNQKPYFLEVSTYRYSGHVGPEGDDHYGYRPKKEIEYWKQ